MDKVQLRCEIFQHELFQLAPYVVFKITILNASVYPISIAEDSVKGNVYLGSQMLSKDVKIIENSARYCDHGKSDYFLLSLWLSAEEVACVLNAPDDADAFRLGHLDIFIKGGSPEHNIESKKLGLYGVSLSSKPLREHHPKLKIEIQRNELRDFFDLSKGNDWEVGCYINMRIALENPRLQPAEIQSFRLRVGVGDKQQTKRAEAGEISDRRGIDTDGTVRIVGTKLSNLNRQPLSVEQDSPPLSGDLQFIFMGVLVDEIDDSNATLIITDVKGEEHRSDFVLKRAPPKSPLLR